MRKVFVAVLLAVYFFALTVFGIAMVEGIRYLADAGGVTQTTERNQWGQDLSMPRPCSVDCK